MSADASCRGLRSDRDGPVVMEFTQGILREFIHLYEANKCALILVFFRVASLWGWLDSMMETHGGASFCQENNFNSSTFNTL